MPVTDATRNGLFRRLRRATSRGPLAPGHNPATLAPPPDRRAGEDLPETDPPLNVEHIAEGVWVLELDGQD